MEALKTYYGVSERKTGLWLNKRILRKRAQIFVRKGDAIKFKREALPDPSDRDVDPVDRMLRREDERWAFEEDFDAYMLRTGVKDPELEVVELTLQEGAVVG